MLIRNTNPFPEGFSSITEAGGAMNAGFGILNLKEGTKYSRSDSERIETPIPVETAFMLLTGKAEFKWKDTVQVAERSSLVDEMPAVLHLPDGFEVEIKGLAGGAEFAVFSVQNGKQFKPRFLSGTEMPRVVLAAGRVKEETKRELRIGADDESVPYSEMTFGEVLNFPGKWSSFPPHYHAHPEIYHYRFIPENGFGYAGIDDEIFKVTNGDTLLIPPGKSHPQVSAPGYWMVYIWVMPHLRGNRFGKDSRQFESEHVWLMEE